MGLAQMITELILSWARIRSPHSHRPGTAYYRSNSNILGWALNTAVVVRFRRFDSILYLRKNGLLYRASSLNCWLFILPLAFFRNGSRLIYVPM
jgi:hypothetical protein